MKYPVISDDSEVQAFYVEARRLGESHRIAEIVALRKVPASKTDVELFRGRGTLADQFKGQEDTLSEMVTKATQNGRTPQYTDLYEPSIANYPGDPEAFIPASGGRGHIKAVCEKNGWDCDGMVKVRAAKREKKKEKT
jgi:hypothetical protein